MRRTIILFIVFSIPMTSMAAAMRRSLYKKDNLHPCRIKQCSPEELKRHKRFAILYNGLGKEVESPALRDRFNFNSTYDFD